MIDGFEEFSESNDGPKIHNCPGKLLPAETDSGLLVLMCFKCSTVWHTGATAAASVAELKRESENYYRMLHNGGLVQEVMTALVVPPEPIVCGNCNGKGCWVCRREGQIAILRGKPAPVACAEDGAQLALGLAA